MKLPASLDAAASPPRGGGKRERILDAATRVFARLGYHRARVADIAAEAGIAYGLVYHYFRNKEEILASIFEERWRGFLEAVEGIGRRPGTTEARLHALAALVLGAYRVRPDWVKVFVLEIQRSARFAEPGQIRAVGRVFALVAEILREGQARGELRRDVDPDVACTLFLGGLELAVTSLALEVSHSGEPEAEYCDKVARTVVDVFVRGVAATAAGEGA